MMMKPPMIKKTEKPKPIVKEEEEIKPFAIPKR